ncbi:beta-ketoacyl synthase chain length factor [Xanthocytophaga agilis]|uniref:Beta-ketoacyl synthase chain length factor n=1 Tax=Xanthocytophaga agilis TaxID=3048010 RepID=A0AAE3QY09_9BACT|nr:beta-ketoacyl synthase chain length factor [Xanthocytophaga agilis]MDJ1500171.1 beta-ketoacyl synthase chain length factor [Xanthocytophaga agilis]
MSKIYINGLSCISPQPTLDTRFLTGTIVDSTTPYLQCQEPVYKTILSPTGIRRMGRLQKMSLVTAIHCLKDAGIDMPDAIVTGTGLGCLEDSEQFLTSIIENTEHAPLSPTSFIQSTHNTVSSQIAIHLKCTGPNYTYSQRHFSFESALLDSILMIKDQSSTTILLHSADEMTPNIYEIIHRMNIWPAPIGEGVSSLLLSSQQSSHSYAAIEFIKLHYGKMDATSILHWIQDCLALHEITPDSIDVVIQGNYSVSLSSLIPDATYVQYKNYIGEYFTASAFAYWLGAYSIKNQQIPEHCIKTQGKETSVRTVLIYNQIDQKYHSLALLVQPESTQE